MVFILLYYIYMNAIRKIMIPYSNVMIPIILILTVLVVLFKKKHKFPSDSSIRSLTISWILIAIYIAINNISLFQQLVSGGMIQFYVMICFMIFVTTDESWFEIWIKWTKWYALIYAIATILFYFNSGLYFRFVQYTFPEKSIFLHKVYDWGWMCGICDHFSTNGMVLATGLMICFEEYRRLKEYEIIKWSNNMLYYVTVVLILYGLILSSKRAPLIASFTAMSLTYVLSSGKQSGKRLMFLLFIGVVIFFVYEFLLPYIPGLSTISDKFESTSQEDGGVLQGREVLWAVAFDMIASSPIVGHGFGSYAALTEKIDMFTTSAHNYYLQVFAELGIIGLFLYVNAFVRGVYLNVKLLMRVMKNRCLVSSFDIMVIKVALNIQLFVVIYNLSATAMMYYTILIPYFLSLTAVCIMRRKYSFLNK